jgi:hypothetical protein
MNSPEKDTRNLDAHIFSDQKSTARMASIPGGRAC